MEVTLFVHKQPRYSKFNKNFRHQYNLILPEFKLEIYRNNPIVPIILKCPDPPKG